jgi:hypothetical protein
VARVAGRAEDRRPLWSMLEGHRRCGLAGRNLLVILGDDGPWSGERWRQGGAGLRESC